MDIVPIPRTEHERLKQFEQVDFNRVRQFASRLDDLKQGRFRRLA